MINLDNKFELRNSLFDAVILTENAYPNKYSYSEYGIGFDTRVRFSLSVGSGKNIIVFAAEMSSPVHISNKIKISWFLVKSKKMV